MSPVEVYERELAEGVLEPDPAQRRVAELLDDLHGRLARARPSSRGWIGRVRGLF